MEQTRYKIMRHYTVDGKWNHVRYTDETFDTLQEAEGAILDMIATGNYEPSSYDILDSEPA